MKETFETSMQKLEEVVKQLESGDLSLDESLKAFEAGVKWARQCEGKLQEAQGKVEMLVKGEDGKIHTTPFGGNHESE